MGNTMIVAAVALGGAIGSVLRYFSGKYAMAYFGGDFPYGTLFVNVTGSFIMGLLMALFIQYTPSFETRTFLTVGILGGFTTFSSFSLDAVNLWERGDIVSFMIYVGASVIVSIMALAAGLFLIRSFA